MSGRYGKDLILYVPPGTVIFDADTGELIGDLTDPGQQLTILKGGRGGRGNQHFATSRNQVPRTAEKGEPAQEKTPQTGTQADRRYRADRRPERGQIHAALGADECQTEDRPVSIYHARAESRRRKYRR